VSVKRRSTSPSTI